MAHVHLIDEPRRRLDRPDGVHAQTAVGHRHHTGRADHVGVPAARTARGMGEDGAIALRPGVSDPTHGIRGGGEPDGAVPGAHALVEHQTTALVVEHMPGADPEGIEAARFTRPQDLAALGPDEPVGRLGERYDEDHPHRVQAVIPEPPDPIGTAQDLRPAAQPRVGLPGRAQIQERAAIGSLNPRPVQPVAGDRASRAQIQALDGKLPELLAAVVAPEIPHPVEPVALVHVAPADMERIEARRVRVGLEHGPARQRPRHPLPVHPVRGLGQATAAARRVDLAIEAGVRAVVPHAAGPVRTPQHPRARDPLVVPGAGRSRPEQQPRLAFRRLLSIVHTCVAWC